MDVKLESSLTICRTLLGIVKDAFGPQGAKSMITTATGKVLVTTDGATILTALNLSHPMAKLIVTSAVSHSNETGCDCKAFLLYVTGALEMVYQLANKHCCHPRNCNPVRKAFILRMSESLKRLTYRYLATELEMSLISSKMTESLSSSGWREIASRVVRTQLSLMFIPGVAEHLTQLMTELLSSSSPSGFLRNSRLVTENFHDLCIKIDCHSYMESACSEGVLIRREFTVQPLAQILGSVKLLILKCSLDKQTDGQSNSHRIQINHADVLQDSLDQKQHQADDFVGFCVKHGIGLILSTEKLLLSTVHKCRLGNIAVVEFVPDSDANKLARLCHVEPVYRLIELCDDDICEVSSVKGVVYRGRHFVEISVENAACSVLAKQLVICAPTEGLCDQVCQALHKAAKLLTWAKRRGYQLGEDENSKSSQSDLADESNVNHRLDWLLIQGGGTFEMFVETFVNKICSADVTQKLACEVVRGAVFEMLHTLYGNIRPSPGLSANRCFLKLHREFSVRVENRVIVGLDGMTGEVQRLPDILESVSCKVATLVKAMELVCQILRIDSIVSVRKLQNLSSDNP